MGEILTFDQPSHTYRYGGRVVPSVTQILKAVFPDVYAGIPSHIIERKAQLGTAVHRAVELELLGQLDYSELHAEVEPYFVSWLTWWNDRDHGAYRPEHKFYSPLGYAGQIDFNGTLDGATWTIDWKITSFEVPTHPIQGAGYALAEPTQRVGCVYMQPDGSAAKMVEHNYAETLPDWMAVLRVYQLQERLK